MSLLVRFIETRAFACTCTTYISPSKIGARKMPCCVKSLWIRPFMKPHRIEISSPWRSSFDETHPIHPYSASPDHAISVPCINLEEFSVSGVDCRELAELARWHPPCWSSVVCSHVFSYYGPTSVVYIGIHWLLSCFTFKCEYPNQFL